MTEYEKKHLKLLQAQNYLIQQLVAVMKCKRMDDYIGGVFDSISKDIGDLGYTID